MSTTQQGLRQASFRAIGTTTGTYNEDARAAFGVEAFILPGATFNGAFYTWLEVRLELSNSGRTLEGLKTQFAILNGAHNWSSLGSFEPFEQGPGGIDDGLAFWYRADAPGNVDDINEVGIWFDKVSGGVNNAIQSVTANKPQAANPINDNERFAIRFDGLNDSLSVTTPPDLSAGCTILTVYHVWTRTDFDGVVSLGDDDAVENDVDSYFAFQLNTAASGDMQVFRDDPAMLNDLLMIQPDPERIAQALITVIDNVAAPGAGEYRDQVNANVTDAFTDPSPAFSAPDNIILGARILAGPTVGSHLEVDLYEVACWVPALSSGDQDTVEAYVEDRYALSTAAVPARLLLGNGGAFLKERDPGDGFLHIGL